MCGRATYRLTWEEIVALYRLTLGPAPHNFRPRFNVCPTTIIDAIVAEDGTRELIRARWGLIPGWWPKPLKDLKLATFNARAETVAEKPFFRGAFTRRRCLIPIFRLLRVARHAGRQATLVFHGSRWISGAHGRGAVGRVDGQRDRQPAQILHDDNHGAQRVCGGSPRPYARPARRKEL
jgi:hypothetical protein